MILFMPQDDFSNRVKKSRLIEIAYYVTFLMAFVIVAGHIGMIARGETSANPLKAFRMAAERWGFFNGLFEVLSTFVFLMWVFILLAHLYGNSKVKKGQDRPVYPYIINILIGIIVCSQGGSTDSSVIRRLLE